MLARHRKTECGDILRQRAYLLFEPRLFPNWLCIWSVGRRGSRRAGAAVLGRWQAGGVNIFFFQGANGRWRAVLSADELTLYDEKAVSMLTPDCRAWLEQGRVAG